jgi:hypothetical protein
VNILICKIVPVPVTVYLHNNGNVSNQAGQVVQFNKRGISKVLADPEKDKLLFCRIRDLGWKILPVRNTASQGGITDPDQQQEVQIPFIFKKASGKISLG